LLPVSRLTAQTPSEIQKKLDQEFALTKTAADKSDIVTAGAVLVLKKDGLLMSATTVSTVAQNTYKDGRLSQGIWKMAKMPGFGSLMSHTGQTVQTRTFVAGEKFWVTKITVRDDGIVFDLFSDPFSDIRYCSTLKFPLTKGSLPTPDKADELVSELIKVQSDDNADPAAGKKKPAADSVAAAPAMAPIAPPPPPADTPPPTPKTIALKQTKDEVAANFGAPTKVVKLGTKEIDYYPDMKVTFVNNKVTNVE
jgi:hypothetical protein